MCVVCAQVWRQYYKYRINLSPSKKTTVEHRRRIDIVTEFVSLSWCRQ